MSKYDVIVFEKWLLSFPKFQIRNSKNIGFQICVSIDDSPAFGIFSLINKKFIQAKYFH